jgi:hypothetical protein
MKSAFVTACGHTVQRGAALVIALILLVILTLLAVTGMRMSVAELTMAGNEQFRHQASAASSAGIEVAIARVSAREALRQRASAHRPGGRGEPRRDSYTVSVRYTGRDIASRIECGKVLRRPIRDRERRRVIENARECSFRASWSSRPQVA